MDMFWFKRENLKMIQTLTKLKTNQFQVYVSWQQCMGLLNLFQLEQSLMIKTVIWTLDLSSVDLQTVVPECVVCGVKLSNESIFPSELKSHLNTKHNHLCKKEKKYFSWLLSCKEKQAKTMEFMVGQLLLKMN